MILKAALSMWFMVIVMFPMVNQAWADGDPPDRPLTSNEKAYFEKVLKTIRTALPPAPENWTETEKPSTSPPKTIPEKSEVNGTYRARYSGKWLNQAKQESPFEMNDAQAQMKLMEEMIKASQSQDKAALNAATAKLKAHQQRSAQSISALSQSPNNPPADDRCIEVDVTVNDFSLGLKKATPLELSGVSRAFMVDDGNPGMKKCPYGCAVVLLGAWDSGQIGVIIPITARLGMAGIPNLQPKTW